MSSHYCRVLIVVAALCAVCVANAQQDFSKVEIKTDKVADGIYMMAGAGGNLGLSVGEDAVFLIDDQYAPLDAKIKAAIAALTDKPVQVRAQHPLARRPHRRQREPRQGGRAHRGARQRAQAHERRAVHRVLQAEGAARRPRPRCRW